MRVPLALLLLLAPAALAGCAGGPAPAPETRELMLYALDGRWTFDPARADAVLAEAGAPLSEGILLAGETMGARALADFVALDTKAAQHLGAEPPAPGVAIVTRAWAAREGASAGDELALRSHAWPQPYVATYFEMERVQPCERRPDAKLCFLPTLVESEARLRLRVDPGGRDAALLPDLVELGPGARPAWWNGSFDGPSGQKHPFSAHAPLEGPLAPAEFEGEMETGEWTVRFRLETRNGVAAAGAAGIVRVREPGYLWFDDRLQRIEDPLAQARAVIENATPTRASVRIATLAERLPLGVDIMLSVDDARALVGTAGATALLTNLTPSDVRALDGARGPDGLTMALRPRPLADRPVSPPSAGDLVFAAPHDIDLDALAHIEGAGAPHLALAGRPGLAEEATLDAEPAGPGLLLLAHAEGPVPWTLPEGARWTSSRDVIENLSRSRTLALASSDLLLAPIATARVELSEGNTTRSLVAIGGVLGGPDQALWTSAALVAGASRAATPRIVLPLEEGADRADVARRALEAWAAFGVVLDR